MFRAWHEAVPARDADKVVDLYAADGVKALLAGDLPRRRGKN
ncbi:hypothetical protein AB0L00_15335 [Actinoallomurus sp. NPDC052308]